MTVVYSFQEGKKYVLIAPLRDARGFANEWAAIQPNISSSVLYIRRETIKDKRFETFFAEWGGKLHEFDLGLALFGSTLLRITVGLEDIENVRKDKIFLRNPPMSKIILEGERDPNIIEWAKKAEDIREKYRTVLGNFRMELRPF